MGFSPTTVERGSDAGPDLTDDQRTLFRRLTSISEMIEQHRATIYMLEREKLTLQHRLRLSGFRVPMPQEPV